MIFLKTKNLAKSFGFVRQEFPVSRDLSAYVLHSHEFETY